MPSELYHSELDGREPVTRESHGERFLDVFCEPRLVLFPAGESAEIHPILNPVDDRTCLVWEEGRGNVAVANPSLRPESSTASSDVRSGHNQKS